jgi:protein SCO1/2
MAISLGGVTMAVLFSLTHPPSAPATVRVETEDLPSLGTIPGFTLTSEQGVAVSLEDLRGKVWIADFIFLRCGGTCPMMSSRMASLAREMAPEPRIRFISFDVDPDRDSVADMKEYAKTFGADPAQWTFLRGEKPEIRSLARGGFKLAVEDAQPGDPEPILHSTRFSLVDGDGKLRGSYESNDPEAMARMKKDARRLAAELSPGSK